ncbi:MAG: PIG-L family deacetylase [Candidatus Latescibacterota bacterium]|nr:MAG: PIG-L family deacetylase [Candidatus Latescibacterota bacterium]
MMKVERVLAVGAHPDDVELGCGGTLALYRRMGAEVVIASVSCGDKGSKELSREETIRVRREESERAAGIISASYISLGLMDSEIFENLENRAKVIELIRKVRPDVIITHSPSDYHADHRTTSVMVSHASYIATSFKFETQSPPLPWVPPVYYMDNYLGVNFVPEEYVDITDVVDTKKEMILQHKSQFPHLKERSGEDILEDMLILARLRGRQSGVKFAEGFRLFRAWPHVRTYRLLP